MIQYFVDNSFGFSNKETVHQNDQTLKCYSFWKKELFSIEKKCLQKTYSTSFFITQGLHFSRLYFLHQISKRYTLVPLYIQQPEGVGNAYYVYTPEKGQKQNCGQSKTCVRLRRSTFNRFMIPNFQGMIDLVTSLREGQ